VLNTYTDWPYQLLETVRETGTGRPDRNYIMSDLQGRKVFKVFNQEFIVDERYNVTKELGQGAYGVVWYVCSLQLYQRISSATRSPYTFFD